MFLKKKIPTWPVLASKSSHCHLVIWLVVYTNILLFVQVSLQVWLENREQNRAHALITSLSTPLNWVTVMNKNKLWGPSLTFHKNYSPYYGTAFPWNHILPSKFCCTFKQPTQLNVCKHNTWNSARYWVTKWIVDKRQRRERRQSIIITAHSSSYTLLLACSIITVYNYR